MRNLALGDTGITVLVSPFACSAGSIAASQSQPLDLVCLAASPAACAKATGYIGSTCGSASSGSSTPNRATSTVSVSAAMLSAGKVAWRLVVDGSNLEPGVSYRMCLDVDGPGGAAGFADTGCPVYVAGVSSIEPTSAEVNRDLTLNVRCSSKGGCRVGAHMAFCDGSVSGTLGEESLRSTRTELRRFGDNWQASLSTNGLTVGSYYQLCVDLDGRGSAQTWTATGLPFFVTGGVNATPAALERASGAVVKIRCLTGCVAGKTQAYLAKECSAQRFGGGSAASYVLSLALSQPWVTSDSERSRAATLLEEPGAPYGNYLATMDLTPLRAGLTARLCIDYAGSGVAAGDSGVGIYMAGVKGMQQRAVRRAPAQVLQITCSVGCVTFVTEAYLSTACPPSLPAVGAGAAPSSSSVSTLSGRFLGAAPNFEVTLDTSKLLLGKNYRLCTDLDGAVGSLPAGDSSVQVHVSALEARDATNGILKVQRAKAQAVRILCNEGCGMSTRVTLIAENSTCADVAKAALSSGYLVADGYAAASGALGGFGTAAWTVQIDASALSVGAGARLCADLDGYGVVFQAGDIGVTVLIVKAPS
ncbi:unnamed protein product [Polarella glacialis]|uniref:Uncharacterized protein n=2 Tax=Polarella glacialis TaxID=89957 RepID=A0A813HA92_POLGL|nr:unnamed protein product [Polarella glacialis]